MNDLLDFNAQSYSLPQANDRENNHIKLDKDFLSLDSDYKVNSKGQDLTNIINVKL